MNPIYLDYNATTPVDPRVLEAMLPYFSEIYGNPANGYHLQGRRSAKAIDHAREQVASLIGAKPHEIFFTSGSTESNNLAIQGFFHGMTGSDHWDLLTSVIEHKSVIEPCKILAEKGNDLILLEVDHFGIVRPEDKFKSLGHRQMYLSLHFANNEIGTIQNLTEWSAKIHANGGVVHSDATQAIGKIPVDVDQLGIDLLSMSSHKLYGPKGIGALYIRGGRKQIPIAPLFFGGGQESGLRPGTSNVAGIVGFGAACELSADVLVSEHARQEELRDTFETSLLESIPGSIINAKGSTRLPNTSSVTFADVEGDALLANLPEVMMGTGSACSSGAMEPSHVLQAIGLSRDQASRTIRASLGRFTTDDDIRVAIAHITKAYRILINYK